MAEELTKTYYYDEHFELWFCELCDVALDTEQQMLVHICIPFGN